MSIQRGERWVKCRHLVDVLFLVKRLTAILMVGLIWCGGTFGQETNEVRVLKDLSYRGSTNVSAYEAERCRLDLYVPKGQSDFPTLVWFHGGALKEGKKDDSFTAGIAQRLASLGIGVALPNYRLSPAAKYPAYVEDAAAAVAWTQQRIAEYGGDRGKLFVGGHSAGAYLTLMVGLDSRFLKAHGVEGSVIRGLIPVSGQTMTHYTIREERGLPKNRIFADEAAPIYHVRKDAPPLLIIVGEKDMPARAEENGYLCAALRAEGDTQVSFHTIPDRDHGSVAGKISEENDPTGGLIVDFIRERSRR